MFLLSFAVVIGKNLLPLSTGKLQNNAEDFKFIVEPSCLQETLWWEDTLYTVKHVFKGHFDERTFLGPLDLLPWRVVGRSVGRSVGPSVRPSTPVTQQPIFGSFSKSVGIFLGWISLDLFFVFVKFSFLNF